MKKKEIMRQYEDLYALNKRAYQDCIEAGDYVSADKLLENCDVLLKGMSEINSKTKSKLFDVGMKTAEIATIAGQTAVSVHMANRITKFEETGTYTSSGGRVFASDTFKQLTLPKIRK